MLGRRLLGRAGPERGAGLSGWRAENKGEGEIGQRAKMEKRGRERKEFLFFFQIKFSNSFSNQILKSFLDFVKTSHHNK
jgi:hypothetical protein